MNATQARDKQRRRMLELEKEEKLIYDQAITAISEGIEYNPTKTNITIEGLPDSVAYRLAMPEEDGGGGYVVRRTQTGNNEWGHNISWKENDYV